MTRKQTNRPTFLRFTLAYDKAKLLDLLSNWRGCSFLSTQRNIVLTDLDQKVTLAVLTLPSL